ncbi:MAG: radical SAM protein [Acidobacteriota bacterium]
MRVMLIVPPSNLEIEYGEFRESGSMYNSIGLGSLAAVALEVGHDVKVVDCEAMGYNYEDLAREISAFNPGLVGLQTFCTTIDRCHKCARVVKTVNPGTPVVFGGVQASLFPQDALKTPEVDFVIEGEGEIAFLNLMRYVEGKVPRSQVLSLHYKEGSGSDLSFGRNPLQGLIEDLDTLPYPARQLFPIDRYHSAAQLRGRKTLHLMSSRGCPYRCSYCTSHMTFGKTHRWMSDEKVIGEIEHLMKDFGVDGLQFYDETFTMNRPRVMKLMDSMMRRGIKVPWTCFTRVNLVDKELLDKMAEAGCYQIFYGIESGVQRLLDLIKKDHTLDQARNAVRITRQAGIESVAAFMLTLPTETAAETEATINFGLEIDPDYVYWLTMTPYPGTPLYETALEGGTIINDDWQHYTVFNDIVYVPTGRDADEIKKKLRSAYRRFYLRPQYLARRVKSFAKLPPKKIASLIASGSRIFVQRG